MNIPAQTAETEDAHVVIVTTMEHLQPSFKPCTSYLSRSSILCFSRLLLLAHIVRRMALNPELADHWVLLVGVPPSQKTSPYFPRCKQKEGVVQKATVD